MTPRENGRNTVATKRIRIHELAQRLGVPAGEVLRRAQDLDIEANTVLQSLAPHSVRQLVQDLAAGPHETDPELVREVLTSIDDSEAPPAEGDGSTSADGGGRERDVQLDDLVDEHPAAIRGDDIGADRGADIGEDNDALVPGESSLRPPWQTLGSFEPAYRRRLFGIAAAILAATAVLVTAWAVLRPVRGAESEVVVSIAGLGSNEVDRQLQSLTVMATSQAVLTPVADRFSMDVSDLRDVLSVEIVDDSTVIKFVATDPDAGRAIQITDAVVASYLAVVNQREGQAEVEYLDVQIAELRDELAERTSDLEELAERRAAAQATRLRIETDLESALNRLADLESTLVALRSSAPAAGGSVSFVQGEIEQEEALVQALVEELQALETSDAATLDSEAGRLRDEWVAVRDEIGRLESLQVDLGLQQLEGPRVAVLATAHAVDGAVGLTPVRAAALGILVGGLMAFAWLVVATQIRNRR